MSNKTLGNDAIREIEASMRGLKGTPAKEMALRLADRFGVTWTHIYKRTQHLRPQNKTRADKGKRTFELIEGTDVWRAASLVIGGSLDPDQALLDCEINGYTNLPSLATFRKLLHENGLGKDQRRSARRPYRLWESENPGELYQIDVTALKVRWEDEKTRRILRIEGVDKNHPNLDSNKIRVWQIMAVDDHSRRRFLRYVAATHITSRIMVEFQCELFSKWGIPKKIYTDNGSEFLGYNTRAEQILNNILQNDGGYKHDRHAPLNSQASGKVEVAHKWAEKMDKLVGLAIVRGIKVTIEDLNPFADRICDAYNLAHVHRSTGQTPNSRWHSKRVIVRKLPLEIIESALLSDEFDAKLDASMTVVHKGIAYRVPGVQPYVDLGRQGVTVKIVVPPNIDLLLIQLPGETEFREIEKIVATADKAGDFKSHAESNAENLKKRLKEQFTADNQETKRRSKQTGETPRVAYYNVEIEHKASNVHHLPQKENIISPETVAAVTPLAPSVYLGKQIDYWQAVGMFADHFQTAAECREFLLTVFADFDERLPSKEVEAMIESRENHQQPTRIYAVK